MRLPRRLAGLARDGGSSPVELALGVALIIVPVALLVILLPTWFERQSMARSAAREAALIMSRAADFESGRRDAEVRIQEVAQNHEIDPADVRLDVVSDGDPGRLERGEYVRTTVAVGMPLVIFPWFGPLGGFDWEASSIARVDPPRDLPG